MIKPKNKAKTKKKKYSTYLFRIAICMAIGILLAAVIYLEISRIEKASPNSITFLYSDSCQACPDAEKEVKAITEQAGLKFNKLKYDERGMTPGLMFVYNNTVLVTPYAGSQSFKQQICGFTGIKKACLMAGESW